MHASARHRTTAFGLSIVLGASLALGCAVPLGKPTHYSWFHAPDPWDPWAPKIERWQSRARTEMTPAVSARPSTQMFGIGISLRRKYSEFRNLARRGLATDLVLWLQQQTADHFTPDGASDHWATLEETLASDGDDCDGLELLSYYFLLEAGFPQQEVFRAILYRPADGLHHMVTLWFEDASDPWVLDPTGVMSSSLARVSSLEGWIPLEIFTEDVQFSVR